MNAPQRFAKIWRADSPLARCANCGADQQFHGRPNFRCSDFRAETVDDIASYDLCIVDAYSALMRAQCERDDCLRESDEKWTCGEPTATVDDLAAKHDERASELRDHLVAEIEAATGLSLDQLHEVL